MTNSANRFALIEGVRGLASILVVWSHTMPKNNGFYDYVFDPGKIGVVIFFFISGYLVIPSAARDASAKNFVIKRITRLYPLYWLSLAFAALLYGSALSGATWFANATMAQQLLGFKNAISVYWTLTIEFCLYVTVTAALLKDPDMLRTKLRYFVYGFAVLSIVMALARFVTQTKIPTAIPLGLFCMFVGAWARQIEKQGASLRPLFILYTAAVLPTCILAYSFGVSHNEIWTRYVVTYLIGGGVFYLLLRFPQVDLGSVSRSLGDYSYGIYLFHMLAIYLLEQNFGMERGLILFTVTMIVSTAVSAPLFHYLEKPAANLGRKVAEGSLKREVAQ